MHMFFFTFESQLSQMERVLFLEVFFCIRWVLIGQLEARDIVDKQHRAVRCREVVSRKGFFMLIYVLKCYEWLYDVTHSSIIILNCPSPITCHFSLQLSCFNFQVSVCMALAKVACAIFVTNITCSSNFHTKLSDVLGVSRTVTCHKQIWWRCSLYCTVTAAV